MGKKSSLARQLAGLSETAPLDFDPEEDGFVKSTEEGSDSEEISDERLGTEHYFEVGKSKLRKRDQVALGPQYAGSRVSRTDLQDEISSLDSENAQEFADPDVIEMEVNEEDGEINSDEAFGESDDEILKDFSFRGSGTVTKATGAANGGNIMADLMSDGEDDAATQRLDGFNSPEDDSGQKDGKSGQSLDGEISDDSLEEDSAEEDRVSVSSGNMSNISDADEEDEDSGSDEDAQVVDEDEKSRRAELRKILNEDQRTMAATISQAAKADVEKGIAVKEQRKTFDSLLNVRIRLQKALVASNSMVATDDKGDNDVLPYRAAEEAAIKLLNTLDTLRRDLNNSSSVTKHAKKRKRTISLDTPSSAIWESIQELESTATGTRKSTLEKWSSRVRDATVLPVSGRLNNSTNKQTIMDVIHDQLSNSERLIKRTKMPRSCAPVQAKLKITEDPHIYDDADFYQLLLKELVDQRMMDSSTSALLGDGGQPVPQWTTAREAKTKKKVDTKASKGRKMRYTVHEKLQNFTAPDDRGVWEQDAIDRFFGTLLGQKMSLGEEDGDANASDEDEGVPLAEEALMLFRS